MERNLSNNMDTINKNEDILDITKLILSLMIVAIHTSLFETILYPWLRLAVPIYFIMVSYFFFKKTNTSPENHLNIFRSFISRNIKLYLFWFVVLFPVTVFIRDWFKDGIGIGLIIIIRDFLFNSTFRASWFIMAAMIGVSVVYFLSEKIGDKVIFVLAFICYVMVCIRSSYMFALDDCDRIIEIISVYDKLFTPITNSFPASFVWIVAGKIVADNELTLSKIKNRKLVITGIVLAVGLYVEWKFVFIMSNSLNNDFYLLLFPLCIIVFLIIKRLKISCLYSKQVRKVSTIIYTTHATIAYVVIVGSEVLGLHLHSLIVFAIVLASCAIICALILKLENRKHFSLLKLSY